MTSCFHKVNQYPPQFLIEKLAAARRNRKDAAVERKFEALKLLTDVSYDLLGTS